MSALTSVLALFGITPAEVRAAAAALLGIGTALVVRFLVWIDEDIPHEYVSDEWLLDARRRGL